MQYRIWLYLAVITMSAFVGCFPGGPSDSTASTTPTTSTPAAAPVAPAAPASPAPSATAPAGAAASTPAEAVAAPTAPPVPNDPAPIPPAVVQTPAQPTAPTTTAPAAAVPVATAPAAAASDEQLIVGKWLCVKSTSDGQIEPGADETLAIVGTSELKISGPAVGGVAFEYRLNSKASPKRIDLKFKDAEIHTPAIYELSGDTLRLAYPLTAGNKTPYPKDFEPGENLATYQFRRQTKGSQQRTVASKKAIPAEDMEAVNGLRKDMTSGIALLEAKKYREFLEAFLALEHRQAMQKLNRMDSAVEHMQTTGPALVKLFKILLSEVPTFDSAKKVATFDLRSIHVEGMPGSPTIEFIKSGDKWYVNQR